MKKAFYLFVSLATIATMISCDSKKNEIKNLTVQFVSALNEQDRVTVYDMFPSAKSLMELIPEGLDIKKLKIAIDDSTGNYNGWCLRPTVQAPIKLRTPTAC